MKHVKVIRFPEIENAFICVSFSASERGNGVSPNVSFFYDNGAVGAEWGSAQGPIETITKCDKNHPDARPHWVYEYCTGFGDWTQLGVKENGLPEAAKSGDWQHIFNVLKKHAK